MSTIEDARAWSPATALRPTTGAACAVPSVAAHSTNAPAMAQMIAAGFEVPLGFVVNADGSGAFAAAAGVDDLIERHAEALADPARIISILMHGAGAPPVTGDERGASPEPAAGHQGIGGITNSPV